MILILISTNSVSMQNSSSRIPRHSLYPKVDPITARKLVSADEMQGQCQTVLV